jgi:TIR domain
MGSCLYEEGAWKRPITAFYVYADTDEELRQQLEKHLALLQRQGVLTSWQESQAGALWEQEREQAFNEASLILLLVSADFLASDVCYQEYLVRALERQKQGEIQVLPVLVRPVDVTNAPFLHLSMVPDEWAGCDVVEQSGCGMGAHYRGNPLCAGR